MKVINKNIKVPLFNNLLCLIGVFCILFITSVLFEGNANDSIFKSESTTISSSDSRLSYSTKFQDSETDSQSNFPSDFELTEETETTDENSDDETSENQIISNFLAVFHKNSLKNSFENLYISFQKRIQIPLFLLFNSLKIPTA